jgi:hypothetical protein
MTAAVSASRSNGLIGEAKSSAAGGAPASSGRIRKTT